jgi:endonuclease/exonuclease/phosphatase (EEP) superfamily protein YafD
MLVHGHFGQTEVALSFGLFLTAIALTATLCIMLAPRIWLMDLAVHFRLQYSVLALVACAILIATGEMRVAALAFLVAAVNALVAARLLYPRRSPKAPASPPAHSPTIRLASINVFFRNRQFQRVIDFIARERPDVVVLVEINREWEKALAGVDKEYAHRYTARGKKGKGITVLSRWPLLAAGMLPGYSDVQAALAATLEIHGHKVQLLGVHTTWPMGGRRSGLRNQQLQFLGEYARAQSGALVIVGDLNVSPFSPHFQGFLAAGDLRSASQGHGWQPTWPTFMPAAGIQIDHAVTSAAISVTRFRRGASVGSDHLPIVIEFVLHASATSAPDIAL